jgi:PncC family amidohydrolase
MIGERITAVAGCSDYFLGGYILYSDRMKTDVLGIDPALIAENTSVSEPVAIAMAENVRLRTGASFAISTTGEAGPESASGVPVGTVFVGFSAAGVEPETRRYSLPGGRDRVRGFATQSALEYLRRKILGIEL